MESLRWNLPTLSEQNTSGHCCKEYTESESQIFRWLENIANTDDNTPQNFKVELHGNFRDLYDSTLSITSSWIGTEDTIDHKYRSGNTGDDELKTLSLACSMLHTSMKTKADADWICVSSSQTNCSKPCLLNSSVLAMDSTWSVLL